MTRRSLRVQLIIAFILVSVPAMLASAYLAASVMSRVYEANLERWLQEAARFIDLEVTEAEAESDRVARSMGDRLTAADTTEQAVSPLVGKQIELLESVGYDLIAIYDDQRSTILSSRPFTSRAPLPLENVRGIFQIDSEGKRYLMAGAVRSTVAGGRTLHVLVGIWIDEAYLGGLKVVTSLDIQLFAKEPDGSYSVFVANQPDIPMMQPPADIVRRLSTGVALIPPPSREEDAKYRSAYMGLRGADGSIAGMVSIGIDHGPGFFEQIHKSRVFVMLFGIGLAVSTVVGLAMSNLLVRPLKALTSGVQSITSGDYSKRVPEEGGAEVAELATCFNRMAVELAKVHELEEALRRRDRLSTLGEAAAVIAHEVRNPLVIIKTSTEVVRKRARLNPTEDRMLGYIAEEVGRIEELIKELLDFVRPKEPVRAEILLRSVVDRAASIAAPELTKHHVAMKIVDTGSMTAVWADPDQLHQACLNLILNAMDAMPNGGSITATIGDTAREASLAITDTGTGVPSEIADRIFNPFFTTKAKGTGLGLAKVQLVAEAHGGRVSCASRPGAGATFTLVLPRASARAAA
jgi:signal transduction histidine kinase